MWLSAALSCGIVAGCGKVASQTERNAKTVSVAGQGSSCRTGALRPSAVPPAEGVWSFQGEGGGRIAVMLGPTELRGGSTVVTRSVEALEAGPRGSEFRSRLDTAAMHLDVLPPYGSAATSRARQPTAVYAITPRVLIAAYESCLDAGSPAIRYLRRDDRGRVTVDAMLRRETDPRGT